MNLVERMHLKFWEVSTWTCISIGRRYSQKHQARGFILPGRILQGKYFITRDPYKHGKVPPVMVAVKVLDFCHLRRVQIYQNVMTPMTLRCL